MSNYYQNQKAYFKFSNWWNCSRNGINAHPEFGHKVAKYISQNTGYAFVSSENKFHALTSHDEIVQLHGTLKALATDLMKIANDIRWLASDRVQVLLRFQFQKMNLDLLLCQEK